MITRCFFCHASFTPNETLERMPNARRIAFDAARGRLWLICGSCRRWTLVPIEERWEALEELEKVARDRARVLTKTDNVALLHAGDLSLVRVGRAERREEAWWRFGREYAARAKNYKRLESAGGIILAGALIAGNMTGASLGGGTFVFLHVMRKFPHYGRRIRFGTYAWRGRAECPTCGSVLHKIPYRSSEYVRLTAAGGDLEAHYRCLNCLDDDSGHVVRGADADRLLRRALAFRHFAGASDYEVQDATRYIEESGTAEEYTRSIAARGNLLRALSSTHSIALEIAFNEQVERKMLEMEVHELEERWREEEELAAIVDGELTPLARMHSLVRRLSP